MTVESFLAYLAERGKAPNTIAAYRADLTQLEQFLVRTRRAPEVGWARLTTAEIAAWSAQLRAGYAPATLKRKISAVRAFLRFAGLERQTDALPTIPDVPSTPARTLTDEEAARLLRSPSTTGRGGLRLRDRAMLGLLLDTGIKATELVGANLGDLDLATCWLRVEDRDVPFGDGTRDALVRWLDALPSGGRAADPLFVNHRGVRLTRQGLWLIVGAHGKHARVPWLTPETLRLTCAQRLIEKGTSWHDAARFLGLGAEYLLRRRLAA